MKPGLTASALMAATPISGYMPLQWGPSPYPDSAGSAFAPLSGASFDDRLLNTHGATAWCSWMCTAGNAAVPNIA